MNYAKVSHTSITFTPDGKMVKNPNIIVRGNSTAMLTTELEAIIDLNGKITTIPAPAGFIKVQNGEIFQNGKKYNSD